MLKVNASSIRVAGSSGHSFGSAFAANFVSVWLRFPVLGERLSVLCKSR